MPRSIIWALAQNSWRLSRNKIWLGFVSLSSLKLLKDVLEDLLRRKNSFYGFLWLQIILIESLLRVIKETIRYPVRACLVYSSWILVPTGGLGTIMCSMPIPDPDSNFQFLVTFIKHGSSLNVENLWRKSICQKGRYLQVRQFRSVLLWDELISKDDP